MTIIMKLSRGSKHSTEIDSGGTYRVRERASSARLRVIAMCQRITAVKPDAMMELDAILCWLSERVTIRFCVVIRLKSRQEQG